MGIEAADAAAQLAIQVRVTKHAPFGEARMPGWRFGVRASASAMAARARRSNTWPSSMSGMVRLLAECDAGVADDAVAITGGVPEVRRSSRCGLRPCRSAASNKPLTGVAPHAWS